MDLTHPAPPGYRRLDAPGIVALLAGVAAVAARLGGAPDGWTLREVSDGNLNVVWIAAGPAGSVCVKQAIPHVRRDESWRLPLDRAEYEVAWMRQVAPVAGRRIPALHHYDPALFAIVMENLSPHVILRQGFVQGRRFPLAAPAIGRYVADAAFATSDLALPFERKFASMARFARNEAILRITVDLILADPYRDSPRNRWTSPHLDAAAAAVRSDAALKLAAARLGHRFLTCTQALLHGDLHSGSVMVTETDTRVIDGEFALYGPIGFDLGAFLGNLLLAWFSQPGHESAPGERAEYRDWLAAQIPAFWTAFHDRFLELWRAGGAGDAYPASLFADAAAQAGLEAERARFVAGLFADMLGYAGLKMIRRILGYAHVADLEDIVDPARRAACEAPALACARRLMLDAAAFTSAADVQALLAP